MYIDEAGYTFNTPAKEYALIIYDPNFSVMMYGNMEFDKDREDWNPIIYQSLYTCRYIWQSGVVLMAYRRNLK